MTCLVWTEFVWYEAIKTKTRAPTNSIGCIEWYFTAFDISVRTCCLVCGKAILAAGRLTLNHLGWAGLTGSEIGQWMAQLQDATRLRMWVKSKVIYVSLRPTDKEHYSMLHWCTASGIRWSNRRIQWQVQATVRVWWIGVCFEAEVLRSRERVLGLLGPQSVGNTVHFESNRSLGSCFYLL